LRANLDEETTIWRGVCGRTARTVRKVGRARTFLDPYQGLIGLMNYSGLYMANVSVIRCNDTFKVFAESLKNTGKPPKAVIVACVRKLLAIMNLMPKNNAIWNSKIA
jgi:transposase